VGDAVLPAVPGRQTHSATGSVAEIMRLLLEPETIKLRQLPKSEHLKKLPGLVPKKVFYGIRGRVWDSILYCIEKYLVKLLKSEAVAVLTKN